MKKRGIINAQLAGLIAGLGHKDAFMIGDGGMPIPKGVEIVDLALCGGVPTFRQVMDAVLDEAEIESYTIAKEIVEKNPELQRKASGSGGENDPAYRAEGKISPGEICRPNRGIYSISQYYSESGGCISCIKRRAYL